ncbi:MAG TPA: outer membrane lipoprotein carrier protein LolA [Alphaproteobacteria bacterium]|nr:outer membrane lipoprotein carrier protein LolA [Alphaproteobacteria bacterium]
MSRTTLGRRCLLVLAGAAAASGALGRNAAAAVSQRPLSEQDRADIARVETYLNDIRTLSARFMQVSDTGGTAEGKLFLSRPGKLRLEYDPPVPILMVANGGFLIHYDKQLKAVTHLPINSTPAGLLVRERIALSGDVTVSAVERGPGSLRLTLLQSKDPQAGKITLVFAERPFSLSNWQVVDAQGNVTRVALIEPQVGVPLDPALFRFTDPGMLSPGRN